MSPDKGAYHIIEDHRSLLLIDITSSLPPLTIVVRVFLSVY